MTREFYLELAARGLRMPIGTDLVLGEEHEPEKVRNDGPSLARVIERAAQRWGTPLAFPLMDLRLEKIDMLLTLSGLAPVDADKFHFSSPLEESLLVKICGGSTSPMCAGSLARNEALAYISPKEHLVRLVWRLGRFR